MRRSASQGVVQRYPGEHHRTDPVVVQERAEAFLAIAVAGEDEFVHHQQRGQAQRAGLGVYYWSALCVAALLVAYEFVLARARNREECFRAFLHNHWIGAVVFAGIALDYALRS